MTAVRCRAFVFALVVLVTGLVACTAGNPPVRPAAVSGQSVSPLIPPNTYASTAITQTLPSVSPTSGIERLEAEKLRQEIISTRVGVWLEAGTLVAALVAATISFWSARRSHASQTQSLTIQMEQQRKDRISGLLGELGSDHLAVKVAAIQALSEYSEAAPFLVNMLQVDAERFVFGAIVTAIQGMPAVALPLLLDARKTLHDQLYQLAVRLVHTGERKQDVVASLLLNNETLTEWLNSSYSKRIRASTQARLETSSEVKRDLDRDTQEAERGKILDECRQVRTASERVLRALESVITRASRLGQSFSLENAYLEGIILDGATLSGWTFRGADLRYASLQDADCRGVDFSSVLATGADFRRSRLHDTVFDGATVKNARFDRAALVRASLRTCQGYGTKFVGAKLRNAHLSGSSFVTALFQGCFADHTDWSDCIFKGASFSGAVCNDCDFSGCDFSGTEFVDTMAHRSSFTGAKLSGTKLSRGDFTAADFGGSSFYKIKAYGQIKLDNADWTGATFGGGTEGFRDEVEKQYQKTVGNRSA